MKNLCMIIAIVFCIAAPAFSAESFTTTFTWEQADAADLPKIMEWRCQEVTSGQVVVFPNTGGTGPFVANEDFTLSGVPGQVITHTYRIQAIATNGQGTAWSNQLPKSYTLTVDQIGVPVLISVE